MKLLIANAYEPSSVYDIIYGSEEAKKRIFEIVEGRKIFPASGKNGILIHGLWGTGKTCLAKMLPQAIESIKTSQEEVDYDFIDCRQGVNGAELMKRLESQSRLISFNYSGLHYFILDEVDNLTEAAQASLKAVMNMPSTIFILTSNYKNKVDKGVISRSIEVEMCGASSEKWLPFVKNILAENRIRNVTDEDILKLIDSCEGSARNIMDSLYSIFARKIEEKVQEAITL